MNILPASFVLCVLLLTGCSSVPSTQNNLLQDPNRQADSLFEQFQLQQREQTEWLMHQPSDTKVNAEQLLGDAMQLYNQNPLNSRVQLVSALILYHHGRADQSALILDQLLSSKKINVAASLLRSRIALEQGNVLFAQSILSEQIRLSPMVPTLHESIAATHYLDKNLQLALHSLTLSENLGAPLWRVNYHRGLVYEELSQFESACQFYSRAMRLKPAFQSSRGRLQNLASHDGCLKFQ